MIIVLIAILIGISSIINLKMMISIIISILLFFIIQKIKAKHINKGKFINKNEENMNINISKEKSLILISISVLFSLYTYVKIYSFDYKYKTSEINEELIILSKEEKTDFYNKYICKNKNNDKFNLQINKDVDIGLEVNNKIYVSGYLELPSPKRNDGGFDYRRYLNSQNIYGTITVKKGEILLVDEGKINIITKIKYKIEETFLNLLPRNQAGIINGMINGETKNISKEILKHFKNSGITHLLAVSGSNISYIIMFLSIVLNKVFRKKLIILFYYIFNYNFYFYFWRFCISFTSWNNGDFRNNFYFIIKEI